MQAQEIEQAAGLLRDAAASGVFIAPLRERYPGLDAQSAYAIQQHNHGLRTRGGSRRVGCKIGLTSRTVQQQLGVDQPDFGVLFDDMAYGDSEPVPAHTLHQPKVEGEIAFVLGRDLDMERPGFLEVLQAVDHALPAIEIVGSRIADWNIRFVDTVADNASAGAFVLGGSPRRLADFDLRLCGMHMQRRGETVSVGAGAACMGHPLNAVVWLARTMAGLGAPLRAGDLVLSGALGPMVPVQAGDVFEVQVSGLGNVRAVFDASTAGAAP